MVEVLTSPPNHALAPAVGLGLLGRCPEGGGGVLTGVRPQVLSGSPSGLWASLSAPACLVPRSLFLRPPLLGSSVHGHLCY